MGFRESTLYNGSARRRGIAVYCSITDTVYQNTTSQLSSTDSFANSEAGNLVSQVNSLIFLLFLRSIHYFFYEFDIFFRFLLQQSPLTHRAKLRAAAPPVEGRVPLSAAARRAVLAGGGTARPESSRFTIFLRFSGADLGSIHYIFWQNLAPDSRDPSALRLL